MSVSSIWGRRAKDNGFLEVMATTRLLRGVVLVAPWKYPARLSVSVSPTRTSRLTRRRPLSRESLVRVEAALVVLWTPCIGASGAPNDNQGRRVASVSARLQATSALRPWGPLSRSPGGSKLSSSSSSVGWFSRLVVRHPVGNEDEEGQNSDGLCDWIRRGCSAQHTRLQAHSRGGLWVGVRSHSCRGCHGAVGRPTSRDNGEPASHNLLNQLSDCYRSIVETVCKYVHRMG
ncbi:hypothetical protein QBC39DRAFT_352304 [Podospora conica]|nr:hypothetical protein QBC39DRAFT_352304 [Schizothecium conicum]